LGNQAKIACDAHQRLPVNSYVLEEAVRPAPLPSVAKTKMLDWERVCGDEVFSGSY
jgi:uncharacterized protein YmfQ (DUF2313 family)